MGPRDRPKTGRPKLAILQSLPTLPERGYRPAKVHRREPAKGLYTTIEVPLRIPLLLHQKEEWRPPTGARLKETQFFHHQKHRPTTPDTQTHGSTHESTRPQVGTLYEVRYPM